MASSADGFLGLLVAGLSIEECRDNYKEKLRPFITSFIDYKDKKSRLTLLEKYFNFHVPNPYPGEYDGGKILLDLVEEAVSFTVKEGFSGHEICLSLSLYTSFLNLIARNTELTLTAAIQQLQTKIIPSYSSTLSASSLQKFLKYMTNSIFQHFHLYQFLLTQPQMMDLTSLELEVETPTQDPLSLEDGTEEDAWLKMKIKQDLEAEYDKKIKELESTGAKEKSEADANLEKAQTQLAGLLEEPIKLSQLPDIIAMLVKAHVESTHVSLMQAILKHSVDMDFRMEQIEAALHQGDHDDSSRHHSNSAATSHDKVDN